MGGPGHQLTGGPLATIYSSVMLMQYWTAVISHLSASKNQNLQNRFILTTDEEILQSYIYKYA